MKTINKVHFNCNIEGKNYKDVTFNYRDGKDMTIFGSDHKMICWFPMVQPPDITPTFIHFFGYMRTKRKDVLCSIYFYYSKMEIIEEA
jgi:hypothetical protein